MATAAGQDCIALAHAVRVTAGEHAGLLIRAHCKFHTDQVAPAIRKWQSATDRASSLSAKNEELKKQLADETASLAKAKLSIEETDRKVGRLELSLSELQAKVEAQELTLADRAATPATPVGVLLSDKLAKLDEKEEKDKQKAERNELLLITAQLETDFFGGAVLDWLLRDPHRRDLTIQLDIVSEDESKKIDHYIKGNSIRADAAASIMYLLTKWLDTSSPAPPVAAELASAICVFLAAKGICKETLPTLLRLRNERNGYAHPRGPDAWERAHVLLGLSHLAPLGDVVRPLLQQLYPAAKEATAAEAALWPIPAAAGPS